MTVAALAGNSCETPCRTQDTARFEVLQANSRTSDTSGVTASSSGGEHSIRGQDWSSLEQRRPAASRTLHQQPSLAQIRTSSSLRLARTQPRIQAAPDQASKIDTERQPRFPIELAQSPTRVWLVRLQERDHRARRFGHSDSATTKDCTARTLWAAATSMSWQGWTRFGRTLRTSECRRRA